MADKKLLEMLKGDIEEWNAWRFENASACIDLGGADLSSLDLRSALLDGVNLEGASLGKADLRDVDLDSSCMDRSELGGANLSGASLAKARVGYADLRGADLRDAVLIEAYVQLSNLGHANLSQADLSDAKLGHAVFRGATLSRAILDRAFLYEVDFGKADLRDASLIDADLTSADLEQADLRGADLSEANFYGSRLCGADLRGAYLRNVNLTNADLSGANLSRTDFGGSLLVNTNLTDTDLTGCHVHGAAVWNVKTDSRTKQTGLVITPEGEPAVMVDDLEVAQFIYLLLNRRKLRNVLNAMTQKGVLILGRFGDGGLEVLQAVAARLRELGYLPMLFDFEPSRNRDFTETVKMMVSLARFVIADLSGPSVLKELEATVPDFEVPFIPIIEEGRKQPSMTSDFHKYGWFKWPPVRFPDTATLIETLPDAVVSPAEEIGKRREERRAKLFPQM